MAQTELKCPLCGGGVEDGFLLDLGQGARALEFVQGVPESSIWAGVNGVKTRGKTRVTVQGQRCTQCGYLMLFAKGILPPIAEEAREEKVLDYNQRPTI